MNAHLQPLQIRVPAAPSGRPWRRFVDTGLAPPDDVVEEGHGPPVAVFERYRVEAHATIILVSE